MSALGSLHRDKGEFVLSFERHFAHPAARVWRAISEPSELAHWFPGTVEIDLRPGGAVAFTELGLDIDEELLPTTGTVVELDPPRRLAFTWGRDLLSFELSEVAEHCVLVFTHRFAERTSAPRSAAAWTVCLELLDASLAGAPGTPTSWASYYARYLEEFGTDGTCARDGARALFRFERLVDAPVSLVWEALTSPERRREWLGADAVLLPGAPIRLDAPRVLEHSLGAPSEPANTVKWQLIPVDQQTIVLLTRTVTGEVDEAETLAAWYVDLERLAEAVAGREH